MSKAGNAFKSAGPLLILIIPVVILLAIFFDGHYGTNNDYDYHERDNEAIYAPADVE